MTGPKALLSCTSLVLAVAGSAADAMAQNTAFQSPGTPSYGQTDRFSREFNPAIGVVVDTLASWLDADESDEDGFDLELRSVELSAQARIDTYGWAYAVIVGSEEEVEVDEAAAVWTGWDNNATLKAGRFFVDFGKQMQFHEHDLRTIDRPLALRTFLGTELAGEGLQLDSWFAASDETPVRFSLGVFQSLSGGGHGHGHEEESEVEAELAEADRKDFDELAFTARVTGFTELGRNETLQLGTSARFVPDFALAYDDGTTRLEEDGLDNVVYGLDVTYQRTDDTGIRSWLFGGEALIFDGDTFEAEPDDPMAPTALELENDSFFGWYAFGDYRWSRFDSAGFQVSSVERPSAEDDDAMEVELYYTRLFSEFHRLRVGLTFTDREESDDEVRLGFQYTVFLGPHAHGASW